MVPTSAWGWVALAWGQLLVAYALYSWYLQARANRLKEQNKTNSSKNPYQANS